MKKHTQVVWFSVDGCMARGEITNIRNGFAFVREFLTDLQPANRPFHKVSLDRLQKSA